MMEDAKRQISKALDVLRQVETAMQAEAQMNAAKHMTTTIRPVPLCAAVSSAIVDLEAWLGEE